MTVRCIILDFCTSAPAARGPFRVMNGPKATSALSPLQAPIVLQKSIFADNQNSAGRGRDFLVQDVRDLTASRKIHRRLR
jgi:hypothetical protein